MNRTNHTFSVSNIDIFKTNLLAWAQQFEEIIWLDSNTKEFNQNYSNFDAILAVDAENKLQCDCKNAFEKLKSFQANTKDYIFGYLGYDLKNDIENLYSNNFDGLDFSDLYFFQAKKLFFINGNTLIISYLNAYSNEMDNDYKKICDFNNSITFPLKAESNDLKIKQRISKERYYLKIQQILNHIHRGDIYEVNFCQEFYAENKNINPFDVYQKLNTISSPPFATFLKIHDKFLLSASPERFVKKQGTKIVSQPIKGTARRLPDLIEDNNLAYQLSQDPKERAENIMIVDLVRNDLSKTAIKGSVKVIDLCKVYSFKQVHHLISTVVSKVDEKTNSVDIIKSLFPMGSMTGAPKISAMEIIEELEETKRGLYSGAVGYFTPNGDFDFNVVIRSILYNESNKYISFIVGGAITAQSKIENEYDECLTKAEAMKKALNNNLVFNK